MVNNDDQPESAVGDLREVARFIRGRGQQVTTPDRAVEVLGGVAGLLTDTGREVDELLKMNMALQEEVVADRDWEAKFGRVIALIEDVDRGLLSVPELLDHTKRLKDGREAVTV